MLTFSQARGLEADLKKRGYGLPVYAGIRNPAKQGVRYVIVQPIRFLCDHVEVLYDIGIEAVQVAKEVGISLLHARTVNDDPEFIAALADVVERYIKDDAR